MSVFDSREEDPLLQGDPFAPPANDRPDSTDSLPSSEEAESSDSDSSDSHSVFEDREQHRVVCSQRDAAEGRLDELNASLKQEWVFDHIEFRPASSSLVFVLRRPTSHV